MLQFGTRRCANQIVLLVFLATSGCVGPVEPCDGVKKGDQVHVELVEFIGTIATNEECLKPWGFSIGSEFDAIVVTLYEDEECRSGVAEIDGVGDWTFTRDPERFPSAGTTLGGFYDAESGTCSGSLFVGVGAPKGLNCEPTDKRCAVTVDAVPSCDNPSECPGSCYGDFAVRVQRIE